MPRLREVLGAIAVLFVLAAQCEADTSAQWDSSQTSTYIVYMGGKPKSTPPHKLAESHHRTLASVLKSYDAARQSILYSYTRSLNGFAARLDSEHVAALKRMPGVLSVFPDKLNKLHTTRSWEFLRLEQNGEIPDGSLWKKADYGKDVIIGSLDTGVWPEAASFQDDSFESVPSAWKGNCVNEVTFNSSVCNKKLIGAKFYIKAYELSNGPLNSKDDFRSPRDMDGHGTHTSSTAAGRFVEGANILGFANGTAKGGAPKARLSIYKVCWPKGCYDADILAAMDDAIADGVNILTLSLGGHVPLPEFFDDGIAIGAFHAVQRGITVVCSAGNDGPTIGGVVNVAPWILTVAASSIDRSFSASAVLGDNKTFTGTSLSESKLPDKRYPLVSGTDVASKFASPLASKLCYPGSLDAKKAKDKIVVCLRGVTSRISKGKVVKQARGAGLILANSDAEGAELIADAHVLPATHVDAESGKEIYKYIKNTRSPLGYITPATTVLGVKPSPKMASFSSQGPNSATPDILKPDITAPGMNILAAFTEATAPAGDGRIAKFNVESGTSMSCPHVAGLTALLKALHPDWSPAAIKSALMTSATTYDNTGAMILDGSSKIAGPFNYGSGHVNPNAAADPGLIYDLSTADYMFFLCSLGYSSSAIEILTGEIITCPKEQLRVSDLNYPSVTISNLTGSTTVSRTVTNVGDTHASYEVTINPPTGVSVSIKPDSLNFTSVGEKQSFNLTFTAEKASNAYVFGEFIWSDGKHRVRSPIAIKPTSTSPKDLSLHSTM